MASACTRRRAGPPRPDLHADPGTRRQETIIRFFASSHQLHQLAPRTLVLTALFLIGVALQAVSGILMHHHGPGWTPASVAAHYRGDERPAEASDAEVQRMFAVGDEAPSTAPPLRVARSWGTLLEVAHFHLVAIPLLLFVVAHLFSMAPLGRKRWSGVLCYGSFLCGLLDVLLPFAIRYGSAAFAPLKLVAFIGLEASLLTMTLGTLGAGVVALFGRTRGDTRSE